MTAIVQFVDYTDVADQGGIVVKPCKLPSHHVIGFWQSKDNNHVVHYQYLDRLDQFDVLTDEQLVDNNVDCAQQLFYMHNPKTSWSLMYPWSNASEFLVLQATHPTKTWKSLWTMPYNNMWPEIFRRRHMGHAEKFRHRRFMFLKTHVKSMWHVDADNVLLHLDSSRAIHALHGMFAEMSSGFICIPSILAVDFLTDVQAVALATQHATSSDYPWRSGVDAVKLIRESYGTDDTIADVKELCTTVDICVQVLATNKRKRGDQEVWIETKSRTPSNASSTSTSPHTTPHRLTQDVQ